MRGRDGQPGSLFSYVDLEARVPADHPLRLIRGIMNEALTAVTMAEGRAGGRRLTLAEAFLRDRR